MNKSHLTFVIKSSLLVKDSLLLIMTDICGFAAEEGKSWRSRSLPHLPWHFFFPLNNWLTTTYGNQKSRVMSIIIKRIQPDAPFGFSKWQLVHLNICLVDAWWLGTHTHTDTHANTHTHAQTTSTITFAGIARPSPCFSTSNGKIFQLLYVLFAVCPGERHKDYS